MILTMQSTPKVTFFLFAYNQEVYIRAACEAALAQTYTPLKIILSDDCSSDKTFQVMQEVVASYDGPHEVVLNRNEQNLGLIGHVNHAMTMADADLIVVAAGDDISLPDRTSIIVNAYREREGMAFSFHSAVTKIDVHGNSIGLWEPPLTENNPSPRVLSDSTSLVIGATHAWTKDVFQTFGPITYRRAYEDLVIAFRSALLGGLHYINQPLVAYRVGNGGISTSAWESVKNKKERRARLINGLVVSIDVLEQRRADCLTIREYSLAEALTHVLWEKKISLFVYQQEMPIFKVLFLAIKHGCIHSFAKAYSRRLRRVV